MAEISHDEYEAKAAAKCTLELALIRWSVVHIKWNEIGSDMPNIGSFLAGWFDRVCGAEEEPIVERFIDSHRCGWMQACEQMTIFCRELMRENEDE